MITAALSELKDNLSSCVKQAAKEEILITNHGKPVGVIKGFANADECLEYRLLNDPRFQRIVERSRTDARQGKATRLEYLGQVRRTSGSRWPRTSRGN